MKKLLLTFTILLNCIIMTMCTSETITKVTYQGGSLNWESTMIFDESDKYTLNVKYIGQEEQLPLEATLNAEFLSGNSTGGHFEYSELTTDKFGGFTFENDYDKEIFGSVSKSKNKDKLNVVIKWNNTEETIELSKVNNNQSD